MPQPEPGKLLPPEKCNLVWGKHGRPTDEMPKEISAEAHDRPEEEWPGQCTAAAFQEFEGGMCTERRVHQSFPEPSPPQASGA